MVRWIRFLAVSVAVVCLGVWSEIDNILDSQAQESGAYGKTQAYNKDKDYEEGKNYDKDQDHREARRLSDEADLIASEEAGELEELTTRRRKKAGMDAAAVTAYSDGNHTASEYTDDFYDQDGLGTGRKANGMLFLIYMDRPGSCGDEGYVSTIGSMTRILIDQRIERVQDDVTCSLKTRDYIGAAAEFLEDVEYYVDRGAQKEQYDCDTEIEEISICRGICRYEGVSALLVSVKVAGSVYMGVKRHYSMEPTGRERVNSLLAYRTDVKFAFGDAGDNLIRKFATSAPIPRPTQNHSSGGSGRSSGRSSTHRPSSGKSYGGGDRRS